MDFDRPADDDPRREAVRAWLDAHPSPSPRQLAEAGLVAPHWPRPWGLDADAEHQILIDEELQRAGLSRPANPIGIGWAGPTILAAGTQAQKERYLWPLLTGEEIWCQLFSEPDAGSDLASLSTRAERDGDEWVVNGTKVWTSGAHVAAMGVLIARSRPGEPKRRGISYLLCPMDAPGVTVTPIVDMTGAHSFNLVHLDDVRLPAGALVGLEGDGWRLAKVTLANERVSLSSGGALWGAGPSAADLVALVAAAGGAADPVRRDRLARVWIEGEVLRLVRLRALSARLQGRPPGPEASIQKILADEHGQRIMAAAAEVAGAGGMLEGAGPVGRLPGRAARGAVPIATARSEGTEAVWYHGSLFAPALTIGGGTWAVQRNIVAERVLGLPGEPRPRPA